MENNLFVQSLNAKQLVLFKWYIDVRNQHGSFADDWVCNSFDQLLKDNYIKSSNRSYAQIVQDEFDLTFSQLEDMATPYLWFKRT